MTKQEAEALAKRFERIWTPHCEAVHRWERAIGGFLRIIEIEERVQINIAPDGVMLCEYDNDRDLIGWFAYDTITYKVTWGDFCPSDEDGGCNFNICKFCCFVAQWLSLFRRNCWLSGCDIEASAHEKAEWMQGFSLEEIEAWNLKI